MTEAIIYGFVVGAIVLGIGLWTRSHQAGNPHGKCAYCEKPLAMLGPRSKVCHNCKRTQPWVEEG